MQRLNCMCFRHKANFRRFFSVGRTAMAQLETLHFDNLALRRLPIDSEERNYVRSVSGACFSRVTPTPVDNPETIAYSLNAMALLDLPTSELERKKFAEYFSGSKLLPGSEPAAHCYCGHQFGYFAGQLGDGAAMYLGEVVNSKQERWEIQLKGSGLTPYSRTADGRKVMRSSIREFLCSEAMHYLGIPTTRAGACVTSDTEVVRDIFYDGHPVKEKCTIVLRIAPTFIRFGSFEIFKTLDPSTGRCGPSVGRHEILRTLLDYVIETFYPEIEAEHKNNSEEKYAGFFKQVVLRTARLVAMWQCVGFCHGVLNTDNMSIVGLTIDYGPFGFMDMYNPDHICNGSDDGGRYSYQRQPEMCFWNLKKLAEAIENALPLSVSQPILDLYKTEYKFCYLRKMREKLGLIKKELDSDSELVESLLTTMANTGADFTNAFRCLSVLELPGLPNHEQSRDKVKSKLLEQCYPLDLVIKAFKGEMNSRYIQMLVTVSGSNPEFAARLRNSGMNLDTILAKLEKSKMLEAMSIEEKKEYDNRLWSEWIAMYVDRLKLEVDGVGTDSKALETLQRERVFLMNKTNPRFILRNYIAQNTITKAEAGDYEEVKNVLKRLENPFEEDVNNDMTSLHFDVQRSLNVVETNSGASTSGNSSFVERVVGELPPNWAHNLRVT